MSLFVRSFWKNVARMSTVAIGSVLGLAGCRVIDDSIAAYGMPHVTMTIRGTIRNATDNAAVSGIKVITQDASVDSWGSTDTAITDAQGRFNADLSSSETSGPWSVNVHVEDADSTADGSFGTRDTTLSIAPSKMQSTGEDWRLGIVTDTLDVTVQPKE